MDKNRRNILINRTKQKVGSSDLIFLLYSFNLHNTKIMILINQTEKLKIIILK